MYLVRLLYPVRSVGPQSVFYTDRFLMLCKLFMFCLRDFVGGLDFLVKKKSCYCRKQHHYITSTKTDQFSNTVIVLLI